MAWEYLLHPLPTIKIDAPFNKRVVKDGDEAKTVTLLDDLNALGAENWQVLFVWPDSSHVLMGRETGKGKS